jgi:hypothetical protein
MELKLLFDEERIIVGEEQSRDATEEDGFEGDGDGWEITWADTLFRRVRLFKVDASISRNRSAHLGLQSFPLYVIVEDVCDWIGEDPQWPISRQKKRTYVTGRDSTRIRQAAAIADAYGGKVNA